MIPPTLLCACGGTMVLVLVRVVASMIRTTYRCEDCGAERTEEV